MTPLRALLSGLIDYAGLFPPAALSMAESVANYARYAAGEHGWMLGRFIVPSARLGEFELACSAAGVGDGWKVSVIGMPGDQSRVCGARVDTCEIKANRPEDIVDVMGQLPAHVTPYFEVPVDCDPTNFVTTLVRMGARAKCRTGGEKVPASADLARFVQNCSANCVQFKATAGLHHPIRCVHGPGHGFVNLSLAAALVFSWGDAQQAVATLEETSPEAFCFDNESVKWHGHLLTARQVRAARDHLFVSFGSCSFEEPVNDLGALGWL